MVDRFTGGAQAEQEPDAEPLDYRSSDYTPLYLADVFEQSERWLETLKSRDMQRVFVQYVVDCK